MKIFRIHTGGRNDISGWGSSNRLDDTAIDNIKDSIEDPDGTVQSSFSSIPSPFARFSILKTALKYVSDNRDNQNHLEGSTLYNKIVSNCLDVGELFFRFGDDQNIRIFEYAINNIDKRTVLGSALDLFLKRDKANEVDPNNLGPDEPQPDTKYFFNFNSFDKMYILEYRSVVIGGTSPVSMFWARENIQEILEKEGLAISNNGCKLFTSTRSLNERSLEYQLFIHEMFSQDENLRRKMHYFNEYVVRCRENNINNINNLMQNMGQRTLTTIEISGTECSIPISVLENCCLKKYVLTVDDILNNSPLIIKPDFNIQGVRLPLVMHNFGNVAAFIGTVNPPSNDYISTGVGLPEGTPVPYKDDRDIENRTLPGFNERPYPYVTLNDFFEDYIVETCYPVNDERFFYLKDHADFASPSPCYLFPIKETFFRYFKIATLTDNNISLRIIRDNANNISSIALKLKIPIKGDDINGDRRYVEYTKNYTYRDVAGSVGKIMKAKSEIKEFCLTFFPFTKPTARNPVVVSLSSIGDKNYSLGFYNNNQKLEGIDDVEDRQYTTDLEPAFSHHYEVKKAFNLIKINVAQQYSAMIIPKLRNYDTINSDSQFIFSVDIGTTNTHIECAINGDVVDLDLFDHDYAANLFKYDSETQPDNQLDKEKFGDTSLGKIIFSEFFPSNKFFRNRMRFPLRSALWTKDGMNLDNAHLYSNLGWDFLFEKRSDKLYDKTKKTVTGYKWSGGNSYNLMKKSIEQICQIIKNFVLERKGNPQNIRIVTFFPSSMASAHQRRLEQVWKNEIQGIIGIEDVENKFTWITESIAPVKFIEGLDAANFRGDGTIVSVDIGGGSTDIAIINNQSIWGTTSFQFAGDAIFGDYFAQASTAIKNHFAQKYYNIFKPALSQVLAKDESRERDQMLNGKSEDLHSFLFSVEQLNYGNKLKEDTGFAFTLLYFYSAILYHVCEIIKKSEEIEDSITIPRSISFSGNGSKLLSLISNLGDADLQKFTNKFFENYFNKMDVVIELKTVKNFIDGTPDEKKKRTPKTITALGGISFLKSINEINPTNYYADNSKIFIYHPSGLFYRKSNIDQGITFKDARLNKKLYLDEVVKFNEIYFKCIEQFKGSITTDRSYDQKIKEILNDYECIKNFYEAGINLLNDGVGERNTTENEKLPETAFFLPIKGIISKLLSEL